MLSGVIAARPDQPDWRWRRAIALVDAAKLLPDSARTTADSLLAQAVAEAREAVRLAPDLAHAHFAVALALGQAGLSHGARDRVRDAATIREAALRALALDPDHDGAWHVLGRWHADIRRLSGVERFVARRILGGATFGDATWEGAIRALEQAVALRPDWIFHRLDLALVLRDAGRSPEALPHLEAIPSLPIRDAADGRYRAQAGDLLRQLRQPDRRG